MLGSSGGFKISMELQEGKKMLGKVFSSSLDIKEKDLL